MSEQEFEDLSNLNVVAANEFKHALAGNTALLPEWKQITTQLFENGIPQDLDALSKLITEESNAETEAT